MLHFVDSVFHPLVDPKVRRFLKLATTAPSAFRAFSDRPATTQGPLSDMERRQQAF